jgi:transcriptional regulator with XRE-family HTH domain
MAGTVDFSQWLQREIEQRGWRQSDLARHSGIDSGLISRILNGERKPGIETCRAIARAFGLADIQVLDIAGLATNQDRAKFSPTIEAIAMMLNDLPESDQEEIRAMVRVKFERIQRHHGKVKP